MPSTPPRTDNIYLTGSVPALFLRTAAPIVLLMLVNGLYIVVDTYFIGIFVGADAVSAVSLMFPLYMMLIALATLVSNGFSSIYARMLGGDAKPEARELMASAVQLTLIVCAFLAVGYALFGGAAIYAITNESEVLSALAWDYMSPAIFCSVIVFLTTINIDALRGEGYLPAMAGFTLLSGLFNILFDWLLLGVLGFGISGSSWASIISQSIALMCIAGYRLRLGIWVNPLRNKLITCHWKDLLTLGAPQSLGYVGLSLTSAVTVFALQIWAQDSFAATIAAYGICLRLMTFIYLPLLGMSIAFQTMVGNNYGAGKNTRVNAIILTVMGAALIYCTIAEVLFQILAPFLGGFFVDDVFIQIEVARILPIITISLIIFGPLLIIATYYQAIGDALHASILHLSRPFLLTAPLTLLLPLYIGEVGIWYSPVITEVVMLFVTIYVMHKHGLFKKLFT